METGREGLIDQLKGGGVVFPFPRVCLLVWTLLSAEMAGSEGCALRVNRYSFSDLNVSFIRSQPETVRPFDKKKCWTVCCCSCMCLEIE